MLPLSHSRRPAMCLCLCANARRIPDLDAIFGGVPWDGMEMDTGGHEWSFMEEVLRTERIHTHAHVHAHALRNAGSRAS